MIRGREQTGMPTVGTASCAFNKTGGIDYSQNVQACSPPTSLLGLQIKIQMASPISTKVAWVQDWYGKKQRPVPQNRKHMIVHLRNGAQGRGMNMQQALESAQYKKQAVTLQMEHN